MQSEVFHLSKSSDGTREWYSARDAATGVSIPCECKDRAISLVTSLNSAFKHHLTAALVDVPAVEPGEWHRSDGTMGGTLLYTLREDGWRRGKPMLVNDVTVRVERANGSMTDIEPIVRLIHAALAATRSGSATSASGTSAIRQRGESE